jgi:hypothetical protein
MGKKGEKRLPNKKLTKAILDSLIIRPDFKLSLNDALKRKDEISKNQSVVEIVINENNEVIRGELDVVVLRGMEKREFIVFLLSTQDTRRIGNSEIRRVSFSAAKKPLI